MPGGTEDVSFCIEPPEEGDSPFIVQGQVEITLATLDSERRREVTRSDIRQHVARALQLLLAAALAVCVLGSVACTPTPIRGPIRSDPDFIAFIVEIERSKERDLQGLIVAESHADKIVSRYLVRILDETAIFDKAGESYRPARFSAFAEKQWVWIWFTVPAPDEFGATVDALQVAIISD